MKVSFNWLREISGVQEDAAAVISKLTMVGIKFEGQEAVGDDLMIDFEVTVNRPDCLSVYGIARELCAINGHPAPVPPEIHASNVIEVRNGQGAYPADEKALRIVLEDPELCPRYCGQVLTNVKVGPSPEWMRSKIEACGVRSINNVVDVTNYVMLELGQPMHAFDYDRLIQNTIRVRRARGEKLVTLDGKERLMSESMLVIADDEVPVGIGGVMGGKDSEVTDATTTVLLESAYFQPNSVRKTRRELDLSTDASFRFERGADPAMQAVAERRAALLLQKVAGATVHPLLDVSARKFESTSVELRYDRIQRVLGSKIDPVRVDHILTALGFIKDGPRSWKVPSFRVDIKREIDLIEEIARHHGYNNFPDTLPEGEKKYQADYPSYEFERALAKFLQAAGVDEASTYSLINPASPYLYAAEGRFRLLNPISEAVSELRGAVVPGLLEAVEYNVRHRNHDVRLYEIGRVFRTEGEHIDLGLVVWGDYLELKGIVESVLPALDYPRPSFHGGEVLVDGRRIGWVGHAEVEGHTVQCCEIMIDELLKLPKRARTYEPIIPFPFVERDASLILDDSIPYSALEETIRSVQIPELRSYRLVDLYKGKNMPAGKASLTFRFIFQSDTRTLLSEEADALFAKLLDALAARHSAELRK